MAEKEIKQNKSGRFLKKKKKRFPFVLVLLLLLALGAGGWWAVTNLDLLPSATEPAETSPEESTQSGEAALPQGTENGLPAESTQMTEATRPSGNADMPQAYQDVLDRYIQAVEEKWDYIQCEDNQICYMLIFRYDLSGLGYHMPDLNNDGVRELIVSDGYVIYDLYTMQGDDLVWVVSGAERNSYQLCLNGFLANRGSNGAASFLENFLYLKDGELVVKESILFDDTNETSKWMYTAQDSEEAVPINETRYQEIVASYQKVKIPLIPFVTEP